MLVFFNKFGNFAIISSNVFSLPVSIVSFFVCVCGIQHIHMTIYYCVKGHCYVVNCFFFLFSEFISFSFLTFTIPIFLTSNVLLFNQFFSFFFIFSFHFHFAFFHSRFDIHPFYNFHFFSEMWFPICPWFV